MIKNELDYLTLYNVANVMSLFDIDPGNREGIIVLDYVRSFYKREKEGSISWIDFNKAIIKFLKKEKKRDILLSYKLDDAAVLLLAKISEVL